MNDSKLYENLCGNLRYLRRVHGLTQKQMAQIMGISVSKLGKIEKCDKTVTIHGQMICRVCDYFDIAADDILYQSQW